MRGDTLTNRFAPRDDADDGCLLDKASSADEFEGFSDQESGPEQVQDLRTSTDGSGSEVRRKQATVISSESETDNDDDGRANEELTDEDSDDDNESEDETHDERIEEDSEDGTDSAESDDGAYDDAEDDSDSSNDDENEDDETDNKPLAKRRKINLDLLNVSTDRKSTLRRRG